MCMSNYDYGDQIEEDDSSTRDVTNTYKISQKTREEENS